MMKEPTVNVMDIATEDDAKKLSFSLCSFKERTVPYFEEEKKTNINENRPVRYGKDGRYPQFLFNECYLKSTILQTIINGTASYINGDGIELTDLANIYSVKREDNILTKNLYWDEYINDDGDSLIDIIKKVTIDYLVFGGLSIMVKRNSYGEVVDLYWLDFQNCRTNKDASLVYYWEDGYDSKNDYQTFQSFKVSPNAFTSVYYFKGHIGRGVYPVSIWNSAIASVLTSVEIGKFHLSTIRKNFAGNLIINYNDSNYTEEQKKQIANQVKQQFGGADNAGSIMLAFNNGKENAVTIARIPEDSFDKKYDTLKESTMQEIFIAFGATPSLFGFNATSDVFSKEKFIEAFQIYNKTRVQGYQNDIERCFSHIFGVRKAFEFIPFKVEDEQIKENNTIVDEVIE